MKSNNHDRRKLVKTAIVVAMLLAGNSPLTVSTAFAQSTSATWDQNSDGNWTATTNWTGDTAYAEGTGNTATLGDFISANRIITLDAPITIGNITASDIGQNYTISGANILTLDVTTGTPVIDVTTSGRTLEISSQVSGADGLQKNGAGTLKLSSAANNYTGGIVINAGRLSIGVDANLGNAANTITLNGGELNLNQGSTAVSSARDVILNNVSGNQILLQGNQNWSNSGAFTGDGGVTFRENPNGNVSATLTSTSNTFKGALGIATGSGGTITVNMRSLADSSEANGSIIFGNGSSSQTFEWSTAATNGLTLNNRAIEFAGDGNSNGTIKNPNTTQAIIINTDIVIAGTGTKTLTLDVYGSASGPFNAINGNISDGTGGGTLNFTKANNGGYLILSGTNSYSGQTQILNGTLSVNTLADFGENSSIGKGTSGVAVLFGVNSSSSILNYTGGTTSSDRTIQINSANNNNAGGATINNNGSGKLTFTATTFNQTYSTSTAATRPLNLGGSNDGEIEGVIQNSNSFVLTSLAKSGAGTWTLSGTNTYTGATAVNGGKLLINGNSSAATNTVTVSNAGSTLGGTNTVGGNTTLNTGTILSPGAGPGTLTFNQNLTLANGAKCIFEAGDLTDVKGTLTLVNNWTLSLTGTGFKDGGSVTIFTYGTLAASPDLVPTFDTTGLSFTPSGPLSLTDTGSAIVLQGISIPQPPAGTFILLR
jgi:fibronectin-binding autotransporter adhesin